MGTAETTHHPQMMKLTADEVRSLADRTYDRGISKMLDDMPSVQADMRQAARVIWALVTAYELAAGLPLQSLIVAGDRC